MRDLDYQCNTLPQSLMAGLHDLVTVVACLLVAQASDVKLVEPLGEESAGSSIHLRHKCC